MNGWDDPLSILLVVLFVAGMGTCGTVLVLAAAAGTL